MRGRFVSQIAALALTVLSLSAAGCKDKESLIVAHVKTIDANGGTLRSLTLSAAGVSQTFTLRATGLTTDATDFGLYVPSDATGPVNVTAVASEATGCRGYKGEQSVNVPTAGATAAVTITIKPADVCQPDGGAGTTGQGGTGGAGGLGGSPPPGTPPSLTHCTEYSHNDSTGCTPDTGVWSVAFSPNGQFLVTAGDDGRAVVWRFDGRTPTREGHVLSGSGYGIVAFSPDGTQLAYGGSGKIALYTVATWALSRTLTVSNEVTDLAFTPDGQQIISADTDGTFGNVYAHSALAGGSLSPSHMLSFSSTTLMSVSVNAVAVAPATATGFPVAVAIGQTDASSNVTGSVGIYLLTSTGFAGPSNTLSVSTDSGAYTARISPDGTMLASGGADGIVYVWPFPLSSVTPSTPNIDISTPFASDDVDMVAFSPNNAYIAVAGGFLASASIWAAAPPRSMIGSNVLESGDMVSVAFSPSVNAIAGGEYDCGLFLVCAD